MYSNLFSTYESTDSPPIITKGYKGEKADREEALKKGYFEYPVSLIVLQNLINRKLNRNRIFGVV